MNKLIVMFAVIGLTGCGDSVLTAKPAASPTTGRPTPQPSPDCSKSPVLVPMAKQPDCRTTCDPQLSSFEDDMRGKVYAPYGGVYCKTNCKKDWIPSMVKYSRYPECGGVPIDSPSPTPTVSAPIKK